MSDDRKELKTRTITLQVSDEDMQELCELALNAGSDVSGLLEDMIADFTGTCRISGSDEHFLLRGWYERRAYTHFRPYTFPVYLLNSGKLDEAIKTDTRIEELNEELQEYAAGTPEADSILEEKNVYEENFFELINEYRKDTCRTEDASAAPYHFSLYMDELRKYELR